MSESTAQIAEELGAIREYIGMAQNSLKAGALPDLAGLEKRVADICLNVQQADAAIQKKCLPELSALLRSLDECERDLKAWHANALKTGSGS